MKQFFSFMIICIFAIACNNSSSSSATEDTTMNNRTNVENVNGNVPDSSSGMNLNHSLPVDSSGLKDSAKKDLSH